jgi:hypothetical protein
LYLEQQNKPFASICRLAQPVTPGIFIIWEETWIGIDPGSYTFYAVKGSYRFLIGSKSTGAGNSLMQVCNNMGVAFSLNSFNNLSSKLITDLGINYAIDGDNSSTKYSILGAKKSPVIRLNAEDGSISLFGESGSSSGSYRLVALNLGLTVNSLGLVGIGTANPAYKLDVLGTIRAKEVKVDLNGVADYVFDSNYKLCPLSEVEQYVKEHKHLQEIPSAKEVEQNGVSLGEMQNKLLQKVEELTLYVIELKKENELQKKDNEQLLQKITKLEKHLVK